MDYAQLIGSLGFPIVVCVYGAVRFEKILDNNTSAIRELKDALLASGVLRTARK